MKFRISHGGRCRVVAVALLIASFGSAGAARAQAQDADRPEPLKPEIAEASPEAEQQIAGFARPDRWRVNLFAAEPKVANVVAFTIDNRGRFFVCETFRQSQGVTDNRGHDETWLKADLAAQTVEDRIRYHRELLGPEGVQAYQQHDDRIRLVVDEDGDGSADRAEVFADGFNALEEGTGAGVLARGNEVFYTCIPRLWKLVDQDGDGQADERIVLGDGFGVRVAFRGHDMHGLVRGPDGRLYFSIGDRGYNVTTAEGRQLVDPSSGAVFRCEMDGSNLEVFATGLRNPQELAFDDFGNLFTGDNNSDSGDKARWVYVVEGGDSGWRMYYQYLPDRGPFNREQIWHPHHAGQPAYIVPPVANVSDGPSGLAYYPGTGLGDEWKGTFFLADFRGTANQSGVRALRVEPRGAFFELTESTQPVWSILATDVAFGPDGGLYVSDWVDGWTGVGKGRIYRFSNPDAAGSEVVEQVRRLLGSDWAASDDAELARLLDHEDQRIRLEAQWELAQRGRAAVFTEIALSREAGVIPRLHAVWGIGQIGRHDPAAVAGLLDPLAPLASDAEPHLRAAWADLIGQLEYEAAAEDNRALIDDPEARVRYFAILSAGKLRDAAALEAIVAQLAENDGSDPILRHAGIMALASLGVEDQRIAALGGHASPAVRRAAVVALRRRASPAVSKLLLDPEPSVRLEAARAIHDAPIDEALAELAEMIDLPSEDDALIRRVLNANYRLGGADRASALAQYAGRREAPEAMRVEALQMLAAWGNPDGRDRVLGAWRPVASRSDEAAAKAVREHLGAILAGPEAVQSAAVEVAARYGIEDIVPVLKQRIASEQAAPRSRAESLRALAKLDAAATAAVLDEVLEDRSAAVRVAAIEAAVTLGSEQAHAHLRKATQSEELRERQAAWDLLAGIDTPEANDLIAQGVRDYLQGKIAPDTALNVLEAAAGRVDEGLQSQLDQHAEQAAEHGPLGAYRWALAGGESRSGRDVFFTKTELSCVRCHKIGNQGGEVGPDLTGIARQRDPAYLLESLVAPSAQIAKGFETAIIVDDLGKVFTGVVRSEDDETVELTLADGTIERIEKDLIVARKTGNSAMPADLVDHMSRRELRDLVAYLSTLDKDPAARAGHGREESR